MSEADTERTAVKTYVPRYQKERWREHADRLDMSQSEFVRTMVQAGRRGFDAEQGAEEDPGSGGSNPGGDALEDRVEAVLREAGPLSWDDLREELTGDLEERLDEALERLQAADRVRYSGRDGGYTLHGE